MITLSVSLYKYGEFRETITDKFDTRKEVLEFIKYCQEYDDYILDISKQSGECCSKWSQRFTFEGKDYNFAADC